MHLYKLKQGDIFTTDNKHLPIGIPVIIRKISSEYPRKWWNPRTWFSKVYFIEYEYLGDVNKTMI